MRNESKSVAHTLRLVLLVLCSATSITARAEDLDIFMGGTAGTGAVPNIMIMVDNSSNWSRAAQKWPGGDQGAAEMQAILNVLASNSLNNARVGFAGFTGTGSSVGGYVRFGLRDMSVSANKNALSSILGHIKGNINSSVEKVNDNGEAAALYEMYKYFTRKAPFRGGLANGSLPASNADVDGNRGNPQNSKPTAFGQGLTSGFAVTNGVYAGPAVDSCGQNHVIFIVNNAQGSIPTGSQTYEGVSAGDPLPITQGLTETSWTDEWARFLYRNGVTVHILDAYNAQHNVSHSAVLERAATVSAGRYIRVKNQTEIELGIQEIVASIQAANSNFAAASLPISTTNRSQNLNQVFIGMFRPNLTPDPRWVGNLKQYTLIRNSSGGIDLGDARPAPAGGLKPTAINLGTGFVSECAVSFWTSDSGSYWLDTRNNAKTVAGCTVYPTVDGVMGSMWSDSPDGPVVEKGGVAEVIRKGNNPPATNTTPNMTLLRNLYTYNATAANKLEALTATNTGWSAQLLKWVQGYDDGTVVTVDDVDTRPYSEFITPSASNRARPSIHGDVIHSRPLPVNYGSGGVTVYYGANDGLLRAVDASTGRERWAYAAPEHHAKFQRLRDNDPPISFPNVPTTLNPKPKDYFFDGSFGLYQNADDSKVWIFPSLRRGGRMLYGFDVTNPDSPQLKWRKGCPNQANNDGCSDDYENIGQTWSTPSVAFLKGESTTVPMIIVGGGYDTCEDANIPSPLCLNRKGSSVFVINADTGAVVKEFSPLLNGSFAADLALSDANGDGSVDFAYAVTTRGEIFRIDFSNSSYQPAVKANWAMRKVAVVGGGRKFLYPPALLRSGSKMYVAVGSGDREHPLNTQYPYANTLRNRFYMLLDNLAVPASSSELTTPAVQMDSDGAVKNFSAETSCSEPGVTPSSGLKGWYMDLPGRGEQSITSALIAGGMVTFNTNRATPGSSNACANPLGESRGYWLNILNASGGIAAGTSTCGGTRSSTFIGGGLTPSPTLATVVVDGKTETVAIGAVQKSGGASSGIAPQQVKPSISSARRTIYWKSNTAD